MRPRITFIAHGTTKALRAATFGGDDGLDDIGRRGAERLRGVLERADRVFISPTLRARETAEALGLTAVEDARLRDCDFGRWEGLKFNQLLLKEPRKLLSWIKKPETAPHGGETIPEVMLRVSGFMREHTRSDGHTVAITHAAVIRAAVVHVIEAQLPSFWRIDVLPLSMTDFRTNGRRWVLRAITPLTAGQAANDESES